MTTQKAKEYYTVKLGGTSFQNIDQFLLEKNGFSENSTTDSHLYTEQIGDLKYTNVVNLDAYFSQKSSATFYLKTIQPDHAYRNVRCAIYSNGLTADLECDIEEKDFNTENCADPEARLNEKASNNIAENACICLTFDNRPTFEIGKGELP